MIVILVAIKNISSFGSPIINVVVKVRIEISRSSRHLLFYTTRLIGNQPEGLLVLEPAFLFFLRAELG